MPRLGPATGNAERAEFDVVALPNGETRMYVGVGGGGVFAHFRRNEAVRSAPAATVLASWIALTSSVPDNAGLLELRVLRWPVLVRQVRVRPAGRGRRTRCICRAPTSTTRIDYVTGRSNGRAVLVSTNAGVPSPT